MSDSHTNVHPNVRNFVEETQALCKPDAVVFCDGSTQEYETLMDEMVTSGMATPLNPALRPNCHLFRSDPSDVARVEDRTFICTTKQADAGPTNNWQAPDEVKGTMRKLYDGCMKGRTMYVIPFSMGPVGGPLSKTGIQITDSAYVVVNMHTMTRVVPSLLESETFTPCLHSVGVGGGNPAWPCAKIENKYIAHFPEENLIWSYGSGYGGNALLGKKCLALRIASYLARQEGWMAEHMLIMRLTNPEGRRYHIAAAFPSACGKTNLAMITPTIPGWKAECLGDDIAWMKIGADGRLYAINPENGFFGVAPGTSVKTNPAAMKTIEENTIFTNCALTPEGNVWWEGMDGEAPAKVVNWKGQEAAPGQGEPTAHPNARFTAPTVQCPVVCEDWEKPEGVPIDAILFGGRRERLVPLVRQAFSWAHGVFLGATASSETTAANIGAVGNVRYDPMAMTPFCGYHMGDYFGHWIAMGEKMGDKAPGIFYVNWFRKDANGKFLWPGYGDNSRALKWICDRIDGKVGAQETPVGLMPKDGELDLAGLALSAENLSELMSVKVEEWKAELANIQKHFDRFGERLPKALAAQLQELARRLG
ncbi:MAG: phosphoenolpyruvate carboxykinase (GTP) [Bdellovibrionales bacterium]